MSRTTYLSEAARLQRLVQLEGKREMLKNNPAEESARAMISSEGRENLPAEPEIDEPDLIVPAVKDDPISEPPKENYHMGLPHVVIVGADKGGVGKTFVSRAVMDYFKAQGATVRAFDTQQPDGNLKRFFPAETEIVNLSTSDDQIKVFDTVGKNDVTIIDIQAGLLTPTLELLTDIAFFDLVTEGKLNVSVLHVIGSTIQSFNEIEGTAKMLQGVRHFVVTNHTNDAAFFQGIAGVSTDVLAGSDHRIDISKLDERATEYVEAASATFANYAKSGESFVMKGKVNKWLKDTYKAFEAAKLNIK